MIGGLFRHTEVIQSNSEMFVFMTPRVIDEPSGILSEAADAREKLDEIRDELNIEELNDKLEERQEK